MKSNLRYTYNDEYSTELKFGDSATDITVSSDVAPILKDIFEVTVVDTLGNETITTATRKGTNIFTFNMLGTATHTIDWDSMDIGKYTLKFEPTAFYEDEKEAGTLELIIIPSLYSAEVVDEEYKEIPYEDTGEHKRVEELNKDIKDRIKNHLIGGYDI